MKKLEVIFATIILVGLIFKILFLPFASMFVISCTALSALYMYFGFALFNNIPFKRLFKKEPYNEDISEKTGIRIGFAIAIGFALSLLLIGILFNIQRWPMSRIMLIQGFTFLVLFSIFGLVRYIQTKSKFYKRIFIRVIIIGGIGFVLLQSPYMWFHFQYRNYPEYIETMENYWKDPNNEP